MAWWEDLGNWFSDITGNTATQNAKKSQATANQNIALGQNTMAGAAGGASQSMYDAQKLAKKGATQFAKEAGQAGEALGEEMGRTSAAQGTQSATEAARTQGINKGQAALLGGQRAGELYTQGKLQGQQLGMGAYGEGANAQLGAIGANTAAAGTQGAIGSNQAQAGIGQANVGLNQGEQGRQQGQDFMSGIGKLAGGIAAFLGDGGIVTQPTTAVVGEKGPEAVIPLNDMDKVKAILKTVYSTTKKKKEKVNA